MNGLIALALGVIERGLLYSIIVSGMYLTSRVIKRDDLTVEGSYGLGGAVTIWALHAGVNGVLACILGCIAGAAAGLTTALLYNHLRINHLISGIIVTTGAFSLSLAIGSSSASVASGTSLFSVVSSPLMIIAPIAVAIVALLVALLKTNVGLILRATGENRGMCTLLGKRSWMYITIAFICANALHGLCGGLMVQYTQYYSIWSHVGILAVGLTSLIGADLIKAKPGMHILAAAIAYQAVLALSLELDIAQEWNKLLTAVLLVVVIIIRNYASQRNNNVEPY